MKKSLFNKTTIALAIGLVTACAANAYVVGPAGAVPVNGVPAATDLVINPGGIGHSLFVPYYTAQGGNRSYLTLVNTDMRNGKVVKIRYRGASNSDDVLDFTLFLSPGDTWTSVVIASDATLPGKLHTVENDTSCTTPNVASTGVDFRPFRLNPALAGGLTGSVAASETREGYIEIFTEADVPPFLPLAPATANPLYLEIEHVAGLPRARASATAACAGTALTALQNSSLSTPYTAAIGTASAQALGLEVPTTGLMASWAIAKLDTGRTWSGNAVAVEARNITPGAPGSPAVEIPGYGNIVFHPQIGSPVAGGPQEVTLTMIRERTADPLIRGGVLSNNTVGATVPIGAPFVNPLPVDLPDMSTPYLNSMLATLTDGVATKRQAQNLTQALATTSVSNEFLTVPLAATDWTFTMPTRRYNVVRSYAGTGTTVYTDYRFSDLGAPILAAPGFAAGANYFNPNNIVSEVAAGRTHVLCVSGIADRGGPKGGAEGTNRVTGVVGNRDELFGAAGAGGVDFSPAPPPDAPIPFCGEAGVFAYNQTIAAGAGTGVLQASVATRAISTSLSGAINAFGWQRFGTPGLAATGALVAAGATGLGLPVVGFSFFNFQNVSVALPHRNTKP